MIHKLSTATTYLSTYFILPQEGEHILRSRATGFFIRAGSALLLVTNWHVVSGLNPADPSVMKRDSLPPPHYLKVTVANKNGGLSELTLPLYDESMKPRWTEHPEGGSVDIVAYELPLYLEDHFNFIDITSAEDDVNIAEAVATDVYILGYPFSRDELKAAFGEGAPYHLPIWKRGTIASEPAVRFNQRVILIDSLSRPGMSGGPVVIAQNAHLMRATTQESAKVLERLKAGESKAILDIDFESMKDLHVKQFRFLGIYSGILGNTPLSEVALGVCWHTDVIRDLFANHCAGSMPFYAPEHNQFYDAFLSQFPGEGKLVIRSIDGEIAKHVMPAQNP